MTKIKLSEENKYQLKKKWFDSDYGILGDKIIDWFISEIEALEKDTLEKDTLECEHQWKKLSEGKDWKQFYSQCEKCEYLQLTELIDRPTIEEIRKVDYEHDDSMEYKVKSVRSKVNECVEAINQLIKLNKG